MCGYGRKRTEENLRLFCFKTRRLGEISCRAMGVWDWDRRVVTLRSKLMSDSSPSSSGPNTSNTSTTPQGRPTTPLNYITGHFTATKPSTITTSHPPIARSQRSDHHSAFLAQPRSLGLLGQLGNINLVVVVIYRVFFGLLRIERFASSTVLMSSMLELLPLSIRVVNSPQIFLSTCYQHVSCIH
ncbi:hypothetical protein EV361DRAFT_23563 [Lentinula raphanica]|nr:hypothetical protein EV361DRAFT_23563 [Lentinula raphanica]